MSQEDMNSAKNPEQPKDVLTNDFNLNSEDSLIISAENENSQYSDKIVFDQELSAHNISNESEAKHPGVSLGEKEDINVRDSEPLLDGTTNSSERDRQQSNEESETDNVINSSLVSDNKDEEVTETVTNGIIGTPGKDKTEKGLEVSNEDSQLCTELDKSKDGKDIANRGNETAQERQEEDSLSLDGQREAQEHEAEQEGNYQEDFEEDLEDTTQEKTLEPDNILTAETDTDESDTKENVQDNDLNGQISVESAKTNTLEKEIKSEVDVDANDKSENDDQVVTKDGDEIPKAVISPSGDLPDPDSETNKEEEVRKTVSDNTQENDTKKDSSELSKDNAWLEDINKSGHSGSDDRSDSGTNSKQTQETYRAEDDNDDFWDIDEPDKGKENGTSNIVNDNSNSKEETNIEPEIQTPRVDSKGNDDKIRAEIDHGEYITTEEADDITEANSDKKDKMTSENSNHEPEKIHETESPLPEPEHQPEPEAVKIESMKEAGGNKNEELTNSKSNHEQEKKNETKEPPLPEPVQQPEPEPVQIESPLDQLLKRNVEIDGSVESLSELEDNVTILLQSMKTVVKHYTEQLNLQSLRDFVGDMGKFRGDFKSINDAYTRCGQLATTMNHHLKELRHATEDIKNLIYRKFQNEDLGTWIDITPEKEAEKQKLQEDVIAAEKTAMAKAAEARAAMATATVGVAESNQFVSEMETQSAEAMAVAKKASAHAQQALVAAEEARLAAIEKSRAEEAARKRAEERARKKEEEEKKKQAEEEMKVYQEAARKGTSVEDERMLLQQEKERREAERRDPKNWPKYTYAVESGDFDPHVGCIIRAIDGTMRRDDVQCKRIRQESGILQLSNNEELISNIIEISPTDPERKFHFEEPMSVALPICIKRTPLAREAAIKVLQSSGKWTELQTADVVFEDHRDQKFVETRLKKFGTFVVVLRYRKDTLILPKKGGKVGSAVDSRVSFVNKPDTFKTDTKFSLEIQPVDQNNVSDLRLRAPQECEDLYTCSPFIKLSLPTRRTLAKPLNISVPIPPQSSRQRRPQTAVARQQPRDSEARPATARPTTTQERKEESTEDLHFLYLDEKNGWMKNDKIALTQITNKDIVSFDITEPYQRFIILRTKLGVKNIKVEKMASLLNISLTKRNVKAFLRQRNEDLYDVVIACETSEKTEKALQILTDEGFAEGAPPGKDLILKEGQSLNIRFRGNVNCVTEKPRLDLIFNTHIKCRTDLKVTELDTFAQKGLPCYRGFAQVFTNALVPKPDQEGTKKPNEPPEMMETEILLTELLIEIPKPEAEPPKPLKIAPIKLAEGPITDSVLHHLANELGKEWKDVAANLNLKPMRIQAILRQNVNKDNVKTRYDMLVSWAKRIPKSVDKMQILVTALQASGRPDLAEEMRYRGDEFRQQRVMSARVSHLRQAFVKVAKVNTVFKKWKDFAKGLGVPDAEIQKIEDQGGSGQEKCYTSLETWKEMSGEKATIPALATHLKVVKQDRLSRDVEALVAS